MRFRSSVATLAVRVQSITDLNAMPTAPPVKPIPQSTFHSIPKQAKRIEERRNAQVTATVCCGLEITVFSGVYQTSTDSELMAESVRLESTQRFLEIGCGTGIISLVLARRAHEGVAVDINEKAVDNSTQNPHKLHTTNVKFIVSDLFANVDGAYDVIICNPPYTNHKTNDVVEQMFWDDQDDMKRRFFAEAYKYLRPDGRIYFGWANFADIDVTLPFALAADKYVLTNVFSRPQKENKFTYYVLEFTVQ